MNEEQQIHHIIYNNYYNSIKNNNENIKINLLNYIRKNLNYILNNLNQANQTLIEDTHDDRLIPKCTVCLTNNCTTVLIPCGHVCMCTSCSNNITQCPLCRCKFKRTQNLFFA